VLGLDVTSLTLYTAFDSIYVMFLLYLFVISFVLIALMN